MSPDLPAPLHETLAVSLYRVEQSSYQALDLREQVQGHWIISRVLAGEVHTASGGYAWQVRAGEVMLHPPQIPFDEQAAGPGVHQWMMFDATVASGLDLFVLHAVAPVVTLRDPAAYGQAFERLERVWRAAPAPERTLLAAALAAQLLGVVLADWRAAGAPPRPATLAVPNDRFGEVVGYMASNLDRRLSRDDLAARAHMHPAAFDRAFRTIHGATPKQVLRELRLRRAQELLETTELPLEAVAAQSGLGDAAYFSRVWRSAFGLPPGEHRERLKRTRTGYIAPLLEAMPER